MTPQQAYRRNVQSGWTRIEMLLAIYNGTITALDNGIDALNRQQLDAFPSLQLRAAQMCLLIISGIDADASEVSSNLRDLSIFTLEQIRNPDVESWTSARNIMTTIREGFEAIKEQGIRMEAEGAIPPLPQDSAHTLLHV